MKKNANLKFFAFNRNFGICAAAETLEGIEKKLSHRKNYIVYTDDDVVVKAVENGETLGKRRAARYAEEYFDIYC